MHLHARSSTLGRQQLLLDALLQLGQLEARQVKVAREDQHTPRSLAQFGLELTEEGVGRKMARAWQRPSSASRLTASSVPVRAPS